MTTQNMEKEKFIEEKMAEFSAHPCLKYCNDMISLNAARTGGKGYEGKENLSDWLRPALGAAYASGEKAMLEKVLYKVQEMTGNTNEVKIGGEYLYNSLQALTSN